MQLIITNVTSREIHAFYTYIAPGGFITVSRTSSDLERDLILKRLINDSEVTVTYVTEALDSVGFPKASPPSHDNLSRPDASTVPSYTFIWNSDDNAYNYSDGTNWRDYGGNIT